MIKKIKQIAALPFLMLGAALAFLGFNLATLADWINGENPQKEKDNV